MGMTRNELPQDEADERVRIGATVRELREARHLGLDEMANAVKISRPYLSNIEAGRKPLTPQLLGRIADVLDVRPISIVRPNYFPADEQVSA
jgi:transcriptional regulator with XRE-family HTH domain